MNDRSPLLQFKNITKIYRKSGHQVIALNEINLEIKEGETLGVVGESGSGKSTLGKIALNLEIPSKGAVHYGHQHLGAISKSEMLKLRRHMQMIFQDPYASLNPRMNIEQIIGEGIDIHQLAIGNKRREIIAHLLEQVHLDLSSLQRYPHEFSGGQRQRIGIARALAVDPSFIVCDEPLSALDACTQRQVMELLIDLKKKRGLTYLFISHDLNAVRAISDTIAVMYQGSIVEIAPKAELFNSPQHPYTSALLGR